MTDEKQAPTSPESDDSKLVGLGQRVQIPPGPPLTCRLLILGSYLTGSLYKLIFLTIGFTLNLATRVDH
jgi:hypothetical protein